MGSARSTAATPTASSVSLSRRRGRGACPQLMRSIVRRSSPRPGRAPGPSIVRHHGCGATGRALVQARHVPAGRYRRGMIGLPGQRQAVLACRSKLAAGVPRVRPRSASVDTPYPGRSRRRRHDSQVPERRWIGLRHHDGHRYGAVGRGIGHGCFPVCGLGWLSRRWDPSEPAWESPPPGWSASWSSASSPPER